MNIKIITDPVSKQAWAVRLVQRGDRYGLDSQLAHDEPEPLVEFYDTRYAHTALGQFVARYQLGTLLERRPEGLCLLGSEPSWQLSDQAMVQVDRWLREVAAEPPAPVLGELVEDMRRMVLAVVRQKGELTVQIPHIDNYWVVCVRADGSTTYGSYAQDARGPYGTVADLQMWEMAALLAVR